VVALLEIVFVNLEMWDGVLLLFFSNIEVVRKGMEILPFKKNLGVSDAAREGQREESSKDSKESHIELRVDAPTLMFLSG
jgi:hypothetical protein